MARRIRMKITIEGPVGGAKRRLLECIRGAGYTVTEEPLKRGSLIVVAKVLAPHGEVS